MKIWTIVMNALVAAVLVVAGLALGQARAAAPANPSGPGACDPVVRSDEMSDESLARYCRLIREIRNHLIAGRAEQVLALQPAVRAAADAVAGRQERAKARDEARVAEALAHERAGNTGRALRLISQPAESVPDITAFPRAMMLARRDRAAQAVPELEQAARDIPGWADCPLIRETIAAIRSGRPAGDGLNLGTTMGLPSTLWNGCNHKAALGPMPPSLTTHVDFALSRSQWPPAEARKLDQMAASIGQDSERRWIWLVAGHADQSCFPRNCVAENMRLSLERAEAVAGELRRRVPERAGDIQVQPFGMSDPLIDRPGQPEAVNRRADLLARARGVAEKPAPSCPWTVTVYEAGVSSSRRLDGGIPATVTLRPSTPTPVSRGSGFTIAFASDNADYQYFYAWSTNTRGVFNLGQMGAVPSGRLADLRQLGGRLPAMASAVVGRPMAFRIGDDATSSQETIRLVASSLPLSEIEQDLANPPLVTALADPATLTLPPAARIPSKGIVRPDWEPAAPVQAGPPGDLRVEAPPATPPRSPAVPARIVPRQVDCSFTLTWR